MDLSIIIVSWNTCDLLRDCLESVRADLDRAGLEAEVLVIDNASSDGSLAMLRERQPWLRLIENDHNPGFAAANNQGLQAAAGELVLLLNSDTQVRPGALPVLVQFMNERPDAGAAGARLLNPDGSLQKSCYPAPTLFREFWRLFHLDRLIPFGVYRMTRWPLDAPRRVDNIMGACMLVRRETIAGAGLMDENYFMYSEEIDWCQRIRRAGWQVYWVPAAGIVHFGGQSTRQRRAEMFLYLYRGKVLYFRKHHGRFSAVVYKIILFSASVPRTAARWLAWLIPAGRREEQLELAGLYAQLIRALPAY